MYEIFILMVYLEHVREHVPYQTGKVYQTAEYGLFAKT